MKSAGTFTALVLIASSALAQKTYEQLNPAGRKLYDKCTEQAASKPTQEGVRIAMNTCNRRYLSEDQPSPQTTEAFAAKMATQFNDEAENNRPKDVLRMSAEAVGKQVILRYVVRSEIWGGDTPSLKKKFDELTLGACKLFSALPEFTTGGLSITYIYDGDRGERLSNMVVSQHRCDALRWRQ